MYHAGALTPDPIATIAHHLRWIVHDLGTRCGKRVSNAWKECARAASGHESLRSLAAASAASEGLARVDRLVASVRSYSVLDRRDSRPRPELGLGAAEARAARCDSCRVLRCSWETRGAIRAPSTNAPMVEQNREEGVAIRSTGDRVRGARVRRDVVRRSSLLEDPADRRERQDPWSCAHESEGGRWLEAGLFARSGSP